MTSGHEIDDDFRALLADPVVQMYSRTSEGLAYTLRSRGPGFLSDDRHRLTRALDAFLDAHVPDAPSLDALGACADEDDPRRALLIAWLRERFRRRFPPDAPSHSM